LMKVREREEGRDEEEKLDALRAGHGGEKSVFSGQWSVISSQ